MMSRWFLFFRPKENPLKAKGLNGESEAILVF